jgi:hypothetical protein
LPPSIDDYVDEDNGVRAIDAYVELLNLSALEFSNTRKSNRIDGQKAYRDLLVIYIAEDEFLKLIRIGTHTELFE